MDAISYLRFIGALAFVLGLLALAAWALRRYGHRIPGLTIPGIDRPAARLRVVETLGIDPRRRLVLVRRDDIEHLVLVGPEGASVIEANIASRGSITHA